MLKKYLKYYLGLISIFTILAGLVVARVLIEKPKEVKQEQAATTAITGPLSGTFAAIIDYESQADVAREMDELATVGMDTLVYGATKRNWDSCTDIGWGYSSWSDANAGIRDYDGSKMLAKFKWVFDEAQKRNFKIYVGLIWSSYCSDVMGNQSAFIAANKDTVQKFLTNFGTYNSFAGWYTGDEPYMPSSYYWPHFKNIRDAMRTQSSTMGYSPKPIISAPYILGPSSSNYQSPSQFASSVANFISQTGMDIVSIQDAVGAKNVPVYSGTGENVEAFFAAVSQKVSKSKVWSDNELFITCNKDTNCSSQSWDERFQSTAMSRVREQMLETKDAYVSKRLMYAKRFNFSPTKTGGLGAAARRLYDSYIATYSTQMEMITPSSYSYLTPPSGSYPDSGNELFNKKVANVDSFLHPEWVGIVGPADIVVNFPSQKQVFWAGVRVLNRAVSGINFPDSITLYCKLNPSSSWLGIGTWNRWITRTDKEFFLSNQTKLTSGNICSSLRIRLNNGSGSWTFLDEVEIVGKTHVAPTNTPTNTPTPSPTRTPTPTPTRTPTPSPTRTPTPTPTPYINCSVSANPNSGVEPLNNVDLTGNVSGTATGSIRYRFDCTNNGTWESDNTTTSDPYTKVDLCGYPNAGNYTAKLKVDRSGVNRTCTTGISVSPKPTNTPTPTKTPTPTATNTPKPTATNTPKPTSIQTPLPTITPIPTATNTSVPSSTPTSIPGDANGDGHVTGIDYVIWLKHYNTTTTNGYSDGDFSGDGKVTGVDYVIWLNHYGI